MGVLTDYFRAADAAAVVRVLERTEGGSPVCPGPGVFDGVEAKRLDPDVVLGELIAAIRRVPWSVDLVTEKSVWPTTPTPGPDGPASDEDPWATGPWVTELGTGARDTLAGIPDAEVPAAVARWVECEELRGTRAEDVRPLAEELIRLARRASDAGERLYCWICL
ncbi:hypothetical protein ACH47Z_20840 [Streptomyces sp. NPDC020192]|uniref:hypothetical protein n=1 Tax=Streptomyces sp. NPDC020192 TaxID=3365066 RepID=UPI00378BEC23